MTQNCKQCGAVNRAEARRCQVCDALLAETIDSTFVSAGAASSANASSSVPSNATRTEGNLAVAPDWRMEVAHRMAAYRARRRRLGSPDGVQPEFPFEEEFPGDTAAAVKEVMDARAAEAQEFLPAPPVITKRLRPARVERLEIDAAQPAFDFGDVEFHSSGATNQSTEPESLDIPVAPLSKRMVAAMCDALLLALTFGGCVALFWAWGGRVTLSKFDITVATATLGLFYIQYVTLFSLFGGATPGMMIAGLRVVGYDGVQPTPRQLLWRSAGYVISLGTLALGFLWAIWDEHRFSWHDRISQTYLTVADNALLDEADDDSGSTPDDADDGIGGSGLTLNLRP